MKNQEDSAILSGAAGKYSPTWEARPVSGWNRNIIGPWCIVHIPSGTVAEDEMEEKTAKKMACEMESSLQIGLAMGEMIAKVLK